MQAAETLLGTSPTTKAELPPGESGGGGENWANTFKKHVAQRRALPTTIESFDEDDDLLLEQDQEVIQIHAIRQGLK